MRKLLLLLLFAVSQAGATVTLSWTASTTPGVVGYNVYRGTTAGGPYPTLLTGSPVASPYVDSTAVAATTYYYAVTAVDGVGGESALSAQAATVLGASPGSLTFASQSQGTTSTAQVVTLANSGGSPATISNIALSGANVADYGFASTCGTLPATLAAAVTCTVSILFTPSAVGTRTATLTVTDTPHTLSVATALSGTGATLPASSQDEFAGPYTGWVNVKSFGAVGDGVNDDTVAFQSAMAGIGQTAAYRVLYIPAGTYKITSRLHVQGKQSIEIIGEDPATTILKYSGAASQNTMLWMDDVLWSLLSRITFDANNVGLHAVDYKSDYVTNTGVFASVNRITDCVFTNATRGLVGGAANGLPNGVFNASVTDPHNDDTMMIMRSRFIHNSDAGWSLESFNALTWECYYCWFETNGIGATNKYKNGQLGIFYSGFLNNTVADVIVEPSFVNLRWNVSSGSPKFFQGSVGNNNVTAVLQGNRVINPTTNTLVTWSDTGSKTLLDNQFSTSGGPVISGGQSTLGAGLFTIGNVFTTATQVNYTGPAGRWHDVDSTIGTISSTTPTPTAFAPKVTRHVTEVTGGSSAATIQAAVNASVSFQGQRPVVHLQAGTYSLTSEISIPANLDVQIVGDAMGNGSGTLLNRTGGGNAFHLVGPSKAILRDMWINGANSATAVRIDNADQAGARIYGQFLNLQGSVGHNIFLDTVDQVQFDSFLTDHGSATFPSVQHTGGPLGAAGTSRISLWGGTSSYLANAGGNSLLYQVLNGGKITTADVWYESYNGQFLNLTGAGTMTHCGGKLTPYNTVTGFNGGTNDIQVNNFNGIFTMCGYDQGFGFTTQITGSNANQQVYIMGGQNDIHPNWYNNTATAGTYNLLGYNFFTTGSGVTALTAESGNQTAATLRTAYAQVRNTQAIPLSSVPGAGITDVELYGVTANNVSEGIWVTGGGGATGAPALTVSGAVPAAPYVTSSTVQSPFTSGYSGWAGMQFVVGLQPVTVASVGRMSTHGNNSQAHTVKFVLASTGADVAGGSAVVSMAGVTTGAYQYANLAAPITLASNTSYYLVSSENTAGGTTEFFDETNVATSAIATVGKSVFWNGTAYQLGTFQDFGPVNFQTAASGVTFGTQNTGTTSAAQVVTISNPGTAPATLTSINITGPNATDFSQTNTCGGTLPASLAAGASCTMDVLFSPSAVGTRTATLTVLDTPHTLSATVSLSGTGAGAPQPIIITGCPTGFSGQYCTVNEGGNVTIGFNQSVNLTLAASGGSLSCTTGCTSTVYTAPALGTVPALANRYGCSNQPPDSIWSTRVDNLPVNANSANWVASLNQNPLWLTFPAEYPLSLVDNTTPTQLVSYFYTPNWNTTPFPWPVLPFNRQLGALAQDGDISDHHKVLLDHSTCTWYETYGDYTYGLPAGQVQASSANIYSPQGNPTYGVGAYDLAPNGGTNAAATPLLYALTANDMRKGIKHPLGFTTAAGYIWSGVTSQSAWQWPATIGQGSAPGCINPSGGLWQNCPQMGSWFRLTNAWYTANVGSFSPAAKVLIDGLRQYGMILIDIGGAMQVTLDYDVNQDQTVMTAINEVGNFHVPDTAFEAVDVTSLEVACTASNNCSGGVVSTANSARVKPGNGFVVPPAFATITASNGTTTQPISVAIQPITIGTPYPYFTIEAGTFQGGYQLAWWVNGNAAQGVTWVKTSGPGAVTATGVYTPPATSATIQTDVLTGTSVVDSGATIVVRATVVPLGTGPAISLRIDSGNQNTSTVDSGGNLWLADILTQQSGNARLLFDNGTDISWGSTVPDSFVWQTLSGPPGDDITWGPFILPNGNYRISYYSALGFCNGSWPFITNERDNHLLEGPAVYEANGFVGAHISAGLANKYACDVPTLVEIPVTVTNNVLVVSMRATAPTHLTSGPHYTPFINGLKIAPDATAARLTIDNQGISTVPPNGTLQLYAVPWFFTSTGTTWTQLSGPGTLSSTGLYTAPASVPVTRQVRIQATDNGNTAFMTIWATGTNVFGLLTH